MIEQNVLRMLDSPNAEQRKQAVKDLAKSKDRAALPYLSNVFRNDTDDEVRELARKAGVYINKHAPEEIAYGYDDGYDDEDDDGGNYSYSDDDDAADNAVPAEVHVSQGNKERADGLVKQALDMHMQGNNQRAIKYLTQAFEKNPNLARDSYTVGLAATITGKPHKQAVAMVTSGMAYAAYDGGSGTAKRQASGNYDDENPSWGDAIIDLLIYAAVNAGIVILGFLGFVLILPNMINASIAAANASGQFVGNPLDPVAISQLFSSVAIGVVIIYGVVFGLIQMISLLIYYFIIHMVSLLMLSGDGSFTRLIRKMTLFLTFFSVGFTVLYIGTIFLTAAAPDLFALVTIGSLVALGVYIYMSSQRIGETYRFGTGTGCAAQLISGVVIIGASCVCGIIAQTALISAFTI